MNLVEIPTKEIDIGQFPKESRDFINELPTIQRQDIEDTRNAFKKLAEFLDNTLPENRQKSVAFTNLEQAQMWAIKAISHK